MRRLARELGVDLSRVRGTGPDGRITREDVINAVRHANAAAAACRRRPAQEDRDGFGIIRREAMSKIRKTIAANMVRSATTIPHLTNFDDADITDLDRLRKESATAYAKSGIKLTSLAFVLKAVALALKQHPTLNASVDMESGEIIYKHYVNLGIAVDTDRGLIVPVLRGVDQLSIPQIAQGIQSLADKVREGKQTLDDLRGGTFTISNMGAVGGQYSTPIINLPEVAILLGRPFPQNAGGDGRRQNRAAFDDAAEFVVRPSAGRRRRRLAVFERGDRLSGISRPAAVGAVSERVFATRKAALNQRRFRRFSTRSFEPAWFLSVSPNTPVRRRGVAKTKHFGTTAAVGAGGIRIINSGVYRQTDLAREVHRCRGNSVQTLFCHR